MPYYVGECVLFGLIEGLLLSDVFVMNNPSLQQFLKDSIITIMSKILVIGKVNSC